MGERRKNRKAHHHMGLDRKISRQLRLLGSYKQTEANKAFSILRKMFNMAEVWGYQPDGTNPCRHVPMFPVGKSTHLISDDDSSPVSSSRASQRAAPCLVSSHGYQVLCALSLPIAGI
jgi:hypothetical protein